MAMSREDQREVRKVISSLDEWTVGEIAAITDITELQIQQMIEEPVANGTLVEFKSGWYKFPSYEAKIHWAYVTLEFTRAIHNV